MAHDEIIGQLRSIIGARQVLTGEDACSRVENFITKATTSAICVVRPANVEEVSAVLRRCNALGINVVPQGGLTGLAGGAETGPGDIVISLERMTAIDPVDVDGRTVGVAAGATLQSVQDAAKAAGLFYPVDIGARGSATIGGTIATNAGGTSVFRYGMTRQQVLGLEVVLADGTIISSLNTLVKNNAGYDIKQLFIGSEGTLGIITKAILRLQPGPGPSASAFVGVDNFDDVVALLKTASSQSGGALTSFEVMWSSFLELVLASGRHSLPTEIEHPYYVLMEIECLRSAEMLEDILSSCLEKGVVSDAAIAQNQKQAASFWAMREDVDALMSGLSPAFAFDIGIPIRNMEAYIRKISAILSRRWKDAKIAVGGHLADSNLHVSVHTGSKDDHAAVETIVYGELELFRDTISAEHGIGMEKRNFLGVSRTPGEIMIMKMLKAMLDPRQTLNRNKVIYNQ